LLDQSKQCFQLLYDDWPRIVHRVCAQGTDPTIGLHRRTSWSAAC
jgi:hypothetical protein